MADKGTRDGEASPHLRRPLYAFDLPQELLYSLTVKTTANDAAQPREIPVDPQTRAADSSSGHDDGVARSTSCSLCGVSYPSVQEQRDHVKSDLHRYNLKLKVKGLPPLDEASFTRVIGDLDESISGSESEDTDGEDDTPVNNTTLSALLKRQAKLSHPSTGEEPSAPPAKAVSGNAPMYWFSSSTIGDQDVLGLYRAIFSQEEQEHAPASLLEAIIRRQLNPTYGKHSGNNAQPSSQPTSADPHYFLCMIGGGHFAAMVVSLVPEIRKGPGGVEERHAVVLAHKTFHRYTTRRKQGGAQSANDNSKGNAHSVGSSIRRANEAALELDVRAVLAEWRQMINTAELIFVRATGSQNRRTLFGPYDGQVLSSRDKRLRGFPFSTRRATQAELLRSFYELTRLKPSKLVEVIPKPAEAKAAATKPSKQKQDPVSKEDEAAQLHTSQLENLIRRSKAPGVLLYLTKNELPADFRLFPPTNHHHAPTPLHLAASTNSAAVVSSLLLKAKADPSITNEDGKTPYDLAGDQRTRDAFRVARFQLGDDALDWAASHVPAGISQKDADHRAENEKATSDSVEAERRAAELNRINAEEEQRAASKMERKSGPGQSLATAAEKSGSEKREEEARGLTPEMRMRLERERRARAAEERIRRMQGGN